jgi:hypothetical protein
MNDHMKKGNARRDPSWRRSRQGNGPGWTDIIALIARLVETALRILDELSK